MRIGIDIDDTITTNFTQTLLDLYNKKYNDNLSLSDITDYDLQRFLKPECEDVFAEFIDEAFIMSLNIPSSTIDALTKLNAEHEIFFITAAFPNSIEWRDKLLKTYLPWYNVNQLIMCRAKYLLDIDFLIDDNPNNFADAKYQGIIIDKPWNQQAEASYRIGEMFDMIELLKKI